MNVDASSKKRAFEHAGLLFENHHSRWPGRTVTDNLFARERLGSTGLGHGVAIPSWPRQGPEEPARRRAAPAAAHRLSTRRTTSPSALLIFLLVPEAATQRHLEILSEIAEMLSDRELRETPQGRAGSRQGARTDFALGASEVRGLMPKTLPLHGLGQSTFPDSPQ